MNECEHNKTSAHDIAVSADLSKNIPNGDLPSSAFHHLFCFGIIKMNKIDASASPQELCTV